MAGEKSVIEQAFEQIDAVRAAAYPRMPYVAA